jgi:hypothetical protein
MSEYFNRDRSGAGRTYFFQIPSIDPPGGPCQGRFEHVQVADHASVVQPLTAHYDLNPVIVMVQLAFWTRYPRHYMEGADALDQPDFIRHVRLLTS